MNRGGNLIGLCVSGTPDLPLEVFYVVKMFRRIEGADRNHAERFRDDMAFIRQL